MATEHFTCGEWDCGNEIAIEFKSNVVSSSCVSKTNKHSEAEDTYPSALEKGDTWEDNF